MDTYNKLHSIIPLGDSRQDNLQQQISAESINEPDGKLQFLLPPYIKGYNLRHKKWF